MTEKKPTRAHGPRVTRRIKARFHTVEEHLDHLHKELEKLMSTAADLQTQVDRLATAVAALQHAAPAPQLITQEQLDANVSSITDSITKVETFNATPTPTA